MGLLGFLEHKVSDFADRNTDSHLRRLGFDMTKFTEHTQEIIRRDCMNAQYIYNKLTGNMVPFTVAESALLKLTCAHILAERNGNTEIAVQALETIPNLQSSAAGKLREDVVYFAFDLLDSGAEQIEDHKALSRKPTPVPDVKSSPPAGKGSDPSATTIGKSSRTSPWSEYDSPAASRRN